MPLYRKKLKSSTGCSFCRKRHVKCDEQKPSCERCKRRGTSCVYPETLTHSKIQSSILTSLSMIPETTGISDAIVTVVPPVLQPSATAEYTKEIHLVLQYYQVHPARLSQRAESRLYSSFLNIIPLASSHCMLLAALAALLTIFMPSEWASRSEVMLRLSSSAVQGIFDAIATTWLSDTIDRAILSAILLHLCDVRLFWFSSS